MRLRKFCTVQMLLGFVPLVIIVNIFLYVFLFAKSHVKIIPLQEIPNQLVTVRIIKNLFNVSVDWCDVAVVPEDSTLLVPKKDISDYTLELLPGKLNVEPGGTWKPDKCVSQHHVAIIIPYRDRYPHLKSFLAFMHPFLQHQLINYRIFVVEQNDRRPFNRAKLFNIGFVEASKLSDFPCFIFHDVDLIPQNLNNIYGCTMLPRHMTAYIDVFDYKLPYDSIIGGAVAILKDKLLSINGFSNTFYGWGGEDDDFYNRVTMNKSRICRYAPNVAQYVMMSHKKEKPSDDRYYFLATGKLRYKTDGLNSLKYSVLKMENLPLYTRIYVDI